MCKSLLDLIATDKREDDKTKILFPLSEAKIDTDSQYALGGFYEQAEIPFNGNPVTYSPNPLDIGAIYLEDKFDLNVHIPQQFAVQSVDIGDINVIDMPSISDVSEGFYRDIIGCNFYANQDYEFIGMEPCPPFEKQEESYLEYVRKLQNNQNIFDTFAILTGQKLSDTPIGLVGAEALNDQYRLNIESNVVQTVSEYLQTDPFKLVSNGTLRRVPYDISVPRTTIGKAATFLQKLSGGQFPLSYLPNDVFNINYEVGEGIISRDAYYKNILDYTGAGQKQALQDHLDRNTFRPSIPDDDYPVKSNEYLYVGPNAPKPFTGQFNAEIINFRDATTVLNKSGGIDWSFSDERGLYYNTEYNITQHKKGGKGVDVFSPSTDFTIGEDRNPNDVYWVKDANQENRLSPYSLLGKTKDIVNDAGDRPNGSGQFLDSTLKEFKVTDGGEEIIISKGDSVTAFGDWPVDEDRLEYDVKAGDFFRVWTKDRQYSKLNRAISHRGLDRKGVPSVLKNNGLLNFAPTFRRSNGVLLKRYMFSIENLAWSDHLAELPDCEIGAGDLLTGKAGRIMWFPPYNLDFTESVTVDWNEHKFIGRGEPIYTYNNTSRDGTLTFSMIVDHPMVVNKIRGQRTEIWERYFKGDKSVFDIIENTLYERLTEDEIQQIKKAKSKKPPIKKTNQPALTQSQKDDKKVDKDAQAATDAPYDFISVYFPNNVSRTPVRNGNINENPGYQSSFQPTGLDYTYYKGVKRDKKFNPPYDNRTNYQVNDDFFNDALLERKIIEIIQLINDYQYTQVTFYFVGSASQATPLDTTNLKLSEERAESIKNWFVDYFDTYINNLTDVDFVFKSLALSDTLSTGTGENVDRGSVESVRARRVDIKYNFDVPDDTTPDDATPDDVVDDDNFNQDDADSDPIVDEDISPDILDKLFAITECDMFEYLEVYDPHSYRSISEKIRYFHPAFHSMTPEGFNGRLNFLHQCTRQGRNIGVENIDFTTNLAFGRPPVCILRIGDFFHTKMVIKSMNIDYKSDAQIKWDLNPEGFVAPMIANITLNISLIGGQSLVAPLNRLQNALSYNFYASMNMFEPRADSVEYGFKYQDDKEESWYIKEGVRLNKVVDVDEVTDDSTTLNDNRMQRKNDVLKQGVPSTPLNPSPTLNSVVDSLDGENIAAFKSRFNLPLTNEEKQIIG